MNRTDALRRPFAVGATLLLLLLAGVGVAINQIQSGEHRPEGAAERWLDAVGDTTRNGVKSDGRARAERLGPGVAYATLLPRDAGGKSAFVDLQLGKAERTDGIALVPVEGHQHNGGTIKITVTLHQRPDKTWVVTGFGARQPGQRVPSEGGAPPSKAGFTIWLTFGLIALALGVICTWLVSWAGPASQPRTS